MIVELTNSERIALLSLLLDRLFDKDEPKEWFNVLTEETVTIHDLIVKINPFQTYGVEDASYPHTRRSE